MRFGASVVLLAACGDNLPVTVDAFRPDAAEFVPGPNTITIYVTDDTTDVRCRNDGKGPWGYADKISATEYQIHVNDTYEVVVACGQNWRGETVLHAQTIAEGDSDFLFCQAASSPVRAATTATVTGQMLQPGIVSMWDYASSQFAPWTYSLEVLKGKNDLIALDTSNRIAVRRDLDIQAATTLPTLDMASEGTVLASRPFVVTAPDPIEVVVPSTDFLTRYGYMSLPGGSSTSIWEVPAAVLQPDDLQIVYAEERTAETIRTASMLLGTQSTVELMPRLPRNVVLYSVPDNNSLRGDFKNLPSFTDIEISLYDVRSAQHARFTKAWLDAMGHSYFVLELPWEFDPTWRVSLRPEYLRYLYVDDRQVDVSRSTGRYDDVTNVLGN